MQVKRYLRNAGANAARVIASALIALLLPPILIQTLPPASYNTWLLVLQLATYVGYLELGVQSAMSRFVAHEAELNRVDELSRVMSSGLFLMTGVAGVGMLLSVGLAALMPYVFSDIPRDLHGDTRLAVLLVGMSVATGFPAAVLSGAYMGLRRYEIPAGILISGKLVGAALVATAALVTASMRLMAVSMTLANLVTHAMLWMAYRRSRFRVPLGRPWISWRSMRAVLLHCGSLQIWTLGTILVSGLDLTIVGIWDFDAVAYFAIAALAVSFVGQLQGSVIAVLMPEAAALHARRAQEALGRMLVRFTRYGTLVLLAAGLPLFLGAEPLLTLWVGPDFATNASPLLRVLLIANTIRLVSLPYTTMLVGVGEHGRVWFSPIAAGVINAAVSIAATMAYGAIGAALGTLVGGIFETGMHLVYNLPRTNALRVSPRDLLLGGMLRPALILIPLAPLLVLAATNRLDLGEWWVIGGALLLAVVAGGYLAWRTALEAEERSMVLRFLGSVPQSR
jgi:O-antigen/teichoic acid export membrane protein